MRWLRLFRAFKNMEPPRRQDAKGFRKRSRKFFSAPWRLGGYVCLASLFGCSAQSQPSQKDISQPVPIISGDVAPAPIEATAPQTSTGVINSEMYQLQMPFGANSRDDAFWKLVDEDVVDVPTNVLMNSNGFRVGRGRGGGLADVFENSGAGIGHQIRGAPDHGAGGG